MNRLLGLFVFMVLSGAGFAQLPYAFQQLLNDAGMVYIPSERLLPPRSIDSGGVDIDYTVKFPGRNFEIRYHIVPSKSDEIADFGTTAEEWEKTIGKLIIGFAPNDHYIVDAIAPKELKSNYNAESGVVCLVRLNPDFSRSYKYCQLKMVYRQNGGLAIIYYFTDTTNNFELFTKQELRSLMFK